MSIGRDRPGSPGHRLYAERAAGRSQLRHGSLTDRTFELGPDHLWSANGHPSEVATRFAREVMGWADAEPIDLSGDLPRRAGVTVRALGMRQVMFELEAPDASGGRYGITEVDSRPDQDYGSETNTSFGGPPPSPTRRPVAWRWCAPSTTAPSGSSSTRQRPRTAAATDRPPAPERTTRSRSSSTRRERTSVGQPATNARRCCPLSAMARA